MITTDTHFTDIAFKKELIERTQLTSKTFLDCSFDGCSFTETRFLRCRFVNCLFHLCDLSFIQVQDCTFPGVRFENSKVIGVNWALANWFAGQLKGSISFFKCVLNHSTFIGVPLPGLKVINCSAIDVDFRESNLSKADFTGTDLSDSLFLGTDLTEANFRSSRNYHIDPGKNNITGAKFSLPEAMSLLYSMDIDLEDG